MSERPEADKTTGSQALVKQPYESMAEEMKPLRPTTEEKPGTGKDSDKKTGPEEEKGPSKPSTWSGSATGTGEFADGYVMARESDGRVTLTDDVGNQAVWMPELGEWWDDKGTPMPSDWSKGHKPAFSGHENSTTQSPK